MPAHILAYASTFYPKRSVRAYLNQLTQQVFDSMEDKKTEWSLDGIKYFFSELLPAEMYRSRKALLIKQSGFPRRNRRRRLCRYDQR